MPVAGLPDAESVAIACALGNPGPDYERTRHNAGVWCIERLAADAGIEMSATAKLPVVSAKGAAGLRLARSSTYMNRSGAAVGPLAEYFDCAPAALMVVHDEAALPPGAARFKFGGGHGGHNGIRDIMARLGTGSFWRLRIGVGHPSELTPEGSHPPPLDSWVLSPPTPSEKDLIDEAIACVRASWPLVESGDMDAAMREVHGGASA